MHPEVMFDIMKLHIEDLQREAARARLIPGTPRRRNLHEPPFRWSQLRLRKARSRLA